MLGHVGREILRCVECAVLLDDAQARAETNPDGDAPVIADALLEAHLLHARNLIEVLVRKLPRSPGAQDTLRTDFLPSGVEDWTPSPPAAVARLHGHWRVLNRHLSHVSWDRISDDEEWTHALIAQDILDVATAWCDFLGQNLAPAATSQLRAQLVWARTALADRAEPDVNRSTTTGSSGSVPDGWIPDEA